MLYVVLVIINLLGTSLFRSNKKYWIVPITIWSLLLVSFFAWRNYNDNIKNALHLEYEKSADSNNIGDYKVYTKLKAEEKKFQVQNQTFIHLISLQTLLTFLMQIWGYKKTSKSKPYNWTVIIFAVIFIISMILEIMLSIVPTGGMAG